MRADPLTVRAKVLDATVYPTSDRRRLWLVRLQVEEVLAGRLPADQPELSFLVHSPSLAFRSSDPVGQTFRITLTDPLTDPYAGSIEVTRDSQA